ncbi:MAG: four helix bundle protein [Bdellovibrionales bacterium]|nr:four helix bundle protein [Bdellovibrionales bacterium]
MKQFFALELAIEFYQLSKGLKLPSHLRDQFLRALSSVSLNLSEGSAKPTKADRRKFYFIALGSVRECQTILKLHGTAPVEISKKADLLGICVYKLCQAVK